MTVGMKALTPLKPGDRVALAAPAGPVDRARLKGAVRMLEDAGFVVSSRPDAAARVRYFAGEDARRLGELQSALDDREVKAVFLARGGYGSQRIAPLLKKPDGPPKPVIGFSDNTALHGFLGRAWRWPTVHGPHPNPESPEEFSEVVACLAGGHRPEFTGLRTLKGGGVVAAPVAGGCLALLSATFGTPCFQRLAGRIVFMEDTWEPPYRLDRMLTHLLWAGAFRGAAAVVFGTPASFVPKDVPESEAWAVLEDFAGKLDVPVLAGLPCGHVDGNRPLLFGRKAELDPKKGTLCFTQGLTR